MKKKDLNTYVDDICNKNTFLNLPIFISDSAMRELMKYGKKIVGF